DVAAQTTLIVPVIEEPVSAELIGVDTSQGLTTWAIHQAAPTGTFSDTTDFPGTATIVEGCDYVSFTYIVSQPDATATVNAVCSIKGSVAVCVDDLAGPTTTETMSVTPYAAQVGSAT
ncbi:hypothetical protein DFH07DRAFT_696178, partial [Mycena maculata]